jgi:hypothetical protein
MRENRKRHEPRSIEGSGGPETEESMTAWMDGYDQGYEAGAEEARKEFMQTQLLILHTGGNA